VKRRKKKPQRTPPAKRKPVRRKKPVDITKRRATQAAARRERTRQGQDIGKIPKCKNPARRDACMKDFGRFCKTYHPEIFYLPWSKDLRKVIAKIERVVRDHDKIAVAMPRGSGKTRLCQAAVEWAVLSGRHPFVVLIGATAPQGAAAIVWFKKSLSENTLLLEDFPEVCIPLKLLENEPRRCLGQRYKGKKTNIRWGKDQIVLPTIPGSPASGFVIAATSLEGQIRGMWHTLPDGRVVRPTLALADDPQTAEALALDTPIPTPRGFVRMADIIVGDEVFGENGEVFRVVATSEVMDGHECYRVTFDDDSQVVADAGHKWLTSTALQRTNARRRINLIPSAYQNPKPLASVVTTTEIEASLRAEGGRNNHSIPLAGSLHCSTKQLPIPPYTLGAWLGNGDTSGGRITTMDEEMLERVRQDGFSTGKYQRKKNNKAWTCTILGFTGILRKTGFLGRKHIPSLYLFSSEKQRLDLLRGLMDTDGTVSVGEKGIKGIRCAFSNTNRSLIDAVQFLCRSLGIKARVAPSPQKYPGALPEWIVSFITDRPVFEVSRKLSRLPSSTKPTVHRRYITSVERVPSVPVKCIAVNNLSHLYLCGEGLIPTHNSARSQGPNGQTTYRLQTINQDVQGLAGPDQQTAILVPCTVICLGDLADQLLNRKEHPDFRGERTKRLYSWPTNKALWEQYRDMRERAMQGDQPLDEAIDFYRARMCKVGRKLDEPGDCANCPHKSECMDCGAVVDWAERLDDPRNLSAVQAAMHAFHKYGPAGFASEFQNEPLQSETAARLPSADEIMAKANGYARGVVPSRAIHLTSFIDVGDDYLFWLVAGWALDFTGWVIDYGTFPDQGSAFSKSSVRRPLATQYPGAGKDGAILAGIRDLAGSLLTRQYAQEGGPPQQIGLCLVDTGYKPDAVHAALRVIGRPSLRPSRGRGITAGKTQFDDYRRDRCRDMGLHWWVPKDSPQSVIQIDTNFYKTFVHSGLTTSAGDPGALTLFGKPFEHKLLAAHILAEYYTMPSTERGVTVQEWHQHVGQDNEGFDALVGSAVAAAKLGCSLIPGGRRMGIVRRKRVSIDELLARRQSMEAVT
jgi:hypothetical protein